MLSLSTVIYDLDCSRAFTVISELCYVILYKEVNNILEIVQDIAYKLTITENK